MRGLRRVFVVVIVIMTGFGVQADFAEEMPLDRLTTTAKQAIDVAPMWLRSDLEHNLKRMTPSSQDVYSAMIINPSQPRFRDEIAFCVANIGTANLEDLDFVPDLLEENAFYIYDHDQYLDYVRVVDVGDPDQDDDYHTTTYYTVEEDGAFVEYQLPPEIYYWFIVHPKIEDEWAYYIDPDAEGGVPASPPTGVFWRNWLFTITEEIPETDEFYPVLQDRMAGVTALWGNTSTGAVGALGSWIRDTMSFTSKQERPKQPVRIYKLHIGRCGEYQDYTTAAARACLIPCLNTQAVGEDHVWNEFWHQRWVHWEPVNGDGYIDNPLVYEDGWGKLFSGVFNVAGDGWTWDVIDRYSQGSCTVNATVLDVNGDPVDGARLSLRNQSYPGTYGFTGSDGRISLLYGDSIACNAKIISDLGKFPAGSATYEVSSETVDGQTYNWTAQYTTETLPQIHWNEVSTGSGSDYRLNVAFSVTEEVVSGYYAFDKQNIFSRSGYVGSIDLFIVDSLNRELMSNGQEFNAYSIQRLSSDGSFQFELPFCDTWTTVVSAKRKLATEQNVTITLHLEHFQDNSWVSVSSVERDVSLLPGDEYKASISAGGDLGVAIVMPSVCYLPGDTCRCDVTVFNPGQLVSGSNVPLFVILDVYGQYFFAPEFNSFSHYVIPDLTTSETHTYNVLPEFIWPQNAGSITGIIWYAAMTDPNVTQLFGPLNYLEFGWAEE